MMDLVVQAGGDVVTLYNERLDLSDLGPSRITRVSHVEPDELGQWHAAIICGPTLGPFARRSQAIAAEVEWLSKHRLQCTGSIGCSALQNHPLENPADDMSQDDTGDAPIALPVRAGQVVRLLPAYQDEGDEDFVFVAVDDESKGRVLVQLQVDLPIKPTQIVHSHMIDRTRSGAGHLPYEIDPTGAETD